jgi:hypothetical protein
VPLARTPETRGLPPPGTPDRKSGLVPKASRELNSVVTTSTLVMGADPEPGMALIRQLVLELGQYVRIHPARV